MSKPLSYLYARFAVAPLGLLLALGTSAYPADSTPPNVVLILTDNHGPWTLGCYGNPDIQTPNIDRLAARGTLFTRAFANNPVCSPTRATLLTGLMPSQHGVHSYLGGGEAQVGPRAYNTLAEFDTLPSILVNAGYVAGLCGKWHLGDNLHPQAGFTYWVTKPHGGSPGFYDQEIIEDGRIRTEPTYLTDFWTDHAVRFIEQNQKRPFFLYLAYNGPYGLGKAMREPIRNRFRDVYSEQTLPSFPRTKAHPWNFNYGSWIGDLAVIRKYAAEVSGVDDGVGRVMSTLDRLGLTENTLVIFTADQGLAGGHAGFWGMGDHTRPVTTFDWTLTIPLIFHQPGKIEAGQRAQQMVSNYDLLPTVLSCVGLSAKVPSAPKRPGRDFSAALRGKPMDWENVHFAEYHHVRAVRTDRWKLIERFQDSPSELYDLSADPDEHHNLFADAEHAETVRTLHPRLQQFFEQHADPKWDVWRGGKVKLGVKLPTDAARQPAKDFGT